MRLCEVNVYYTPSLPGAPKGLVRQTPESNNTIQLYLEIQMIVFTTVRVEPGIAMRTLIT